MTIGFAPIAPPMTPATAQRATPSAPVPLAAAELAFAVRILRAELALPAGLRFSGAALQTPPRARGAGADPSLAVDRDVVVTIRDPELGAVFEAVVAVDDGFVRSLRRLPSAS